jgi:hypothetical protein
MGAYKNLETEKGREQHDKKGTQSHPEKNSSFAPKRGRVLLPSPKRGQGAFSMLLKVKKHVKEGRVLCPSQVCLSSTHQI